MSEHPVVACYRGLDSADAVQLGAMLARALGEPLVIASAYRYDAAGLSARAEPTADNIRRADAAHEMLRRARQFAGSDVEVRDEVVPAAGITDALLSLARDIDACILVVGRDTSGHVTRSLISRAPCAVAVAPLSVPLPRSEQLTRIGAAYDDSATARSALTAASKLALATGAQLVLLSAGQTPGLAAGWLHAARLSVGHKIKHERHELVGDPAATLAAVSADVDLLVCGSRGRGRALGALLGSVSAHLIAHAQCPVIVVPPVAWRSDSDPLGNTSAATNTGI